MPFTNFFQSSSRAQSHGEQHPELESRSNTPTPPGVSTPRPDPIDKRTPGIFSTYFAQVGAPLPPSSSSAAGMERRHSQSSRSHFARSTFAGGASLPTAPNSRSHSTNEKDALHLLPHERICHPSEQKDPLDGYPTPPTSSSSSTPRPQTSTEESSAERDDTRVDGTVRAGSPRRKRSLFDRLPTHIRRNTLTANPLSSVTTTSTVHASHISSPGFNISHANPACPVVSHLSPSHSPASLSSEHQGLTEDLTSSREQSTPTPPRTPRTQSHDATSRNASPAPGANGHSKSRSKRASHNGTVGEPRGKLSVCITQGRNLRPCVDPYVICQFQWNEYISKGPQNGTSAGAGDDGGDGINPMAIRRTDSEMGRSMAIPMKSRQSSHNSVAARDSGPQSKDSTDPVWNHEAIL